MTPRVNRRLLLRWALPGLLVAACDSRGKAIPYVKGFRVTPTSGTGPEAGVASQPATATAIGSVADTTFPAVATPVSPTIVVDGVDRKLWDATITRYLSDELWSDRDAYDAGEYLMVPLHAAFLSPEAHWQQQFATQFQRFGRSGSFSSPVTDSNVLNRLQFLYLVSRYVAIEQQTGQRALAHPELLDLLYNTVQSVWEVVPAANWGLPPFRGMRERVAWKLTTPKPAKHYYGAILDLELFVFAIAADLRIYERWSGQTHRFSSVVSDILQTARQVYRARVVPTGDGGWLFQPGAWSDHPDYAYAGNSTKAPGMAPSPVADLAEDSSHFSRHPLWLTSLADAFGENDPERAYYLDLRSGLEHQFYQHVLVAPSPDFPAYRTTNYMDGRNGVFRWNYEVSAPDTGYGPYELSGTLLSGWWAFTRTARIAAMYGELAGSFPLPASVIAEYADPNTIRSRNPLVVDPDSYVNGMRQLQVRLASKFTP